MDDGLCRSSFEQLKASSHKNVDLCLVVLYSCFSNYCE